MIYYEKIPSALKIRNQWVLWKEEPDGKGKITKVPYNPQGWKASSTASHTWAPFDEVIETLKAGSYAGIGYVFSAEDPFTGIDLDHCIVYGKLTEEGQHWIKTFNSYTEISPSETGLHILVKGKVPDEKGHKNGDYELYDRSRYFTFTGNRLEETPPTIEDRQGAIDEFFSEVFGEDEPQEKKAAAICHNLCLSDEELIEKIEVSEQGPKFKALYSGDTTGYNSQSEADLALCSILAFRTQDRVQIERMFGYSILGERDKWAKRKEYRDRTIDKALSGLTETYTGGVAQVEEPEAVPEEITQKALAIAERGDPVKYILDTLQNYHAGDRKSAELLLCSHVIGSCLNAYGTQPKLSGGSGKGKTHLAKALKHLLPPEWLLYTSLSPKALYRATLPNSPVQIKPGMTIFSDDIRVSDDLGDTMKRAMSNFQEPATYLIVNKNGNLEEHRLPERLIWWLTSVDDDQEDQLINRFFSVGVDESDTQDLTSLNLTFAPLAEGRQEFPTTDEVLICREIIRRIKLSVWMVEAPFLKDEEGNLNLVWTDPSERRNPGRFADLLAAYAILRSSQRKVIDEGDYKRVIATTEDFEAAKALYESRSENLTTKLTDNELHFVRWLSMKANGSIYDFQINHIAKIYTGPDGKGRSPKSLERLLSGRKDRGTRGLIHKLSSGALTVERKSETISDDVSSQCVNFKLFSFDPSKFKILETYESAVILKTATFSPKDPNRPQWTHPNGSIEETPTDSDIDIDLDRIDPLDPRYTGKGKPPMDGNLFGRKNLSLCVHSGSIGSFGSNGAIDADSYGSIRGSIGGSNGPDLEEDLIQADFELAAVGG